MNTDIMERYSHITGAILAGGKSARMGGNKALINLQGRPFIRHVAETFEKTFATTVIVSDAAKNYSFLNLPVLPDVFKHQGPLGGIHAALTHATTSEVFVATCDVPFLTVTTLRFIVQHHKPDEITIVSDGQRLHPLIGIYARRILPDLEKNLQSGANKVLDFLDETPHSILTLPSVASEFRNINTPEDARLILS